MTNNNDDKCVDLPVWDDETVCAECGKKICEDCDVCPCGFPPDECEWPERECPCPLCLELFKNCSCNIIIKPE